MLRLTTLVAVTLVFQTACRSETTDPGVVPRRDSGLRDAGPPDTGPGIDAPPIDSGPPDGGSTCSCPPAPELCSMPPSDTPAFGPGSPSPILVQQLGLISCADTTLQIAAYESSFVCMVDAIAARLAADPDLVVDIVIDDGQCPVEGGRLSCAWNALEMHPRVHIVADTRAAYMHHKFMIADGEAMWVGSANMTRTSYCTDHNNGLVITEAAIVARYAEVFTRMHTTMGFGPVAAEAPVTAGPYTVYFSPESPADMPQVWFNDMLGAIDAATTTVDFVMFAWTRDEVSMAMTRAVGRGVTVRGVVASEYASDPAVALAIAGGVEVRVGNVHDKEVIIDGNLVITGSPNWSANSWSNNENSLWIRDASIAGAFQAEHTRIFGEASPAM